MDLGEGIETFRELAAVACQLFSRASYTLPTFRQPCILLIEKKSLPELGQLLGRKLRVHEMSVTLYASDSTEQLAMIRTCTEDVMLVWHYYTTQPVDDVISHDIEGGIEG